jgi:hypothetical protein
LAGEPAEPFFLPKSRHFSPLRESEIPALARITSFRASKLIQLRNPQPEAA